MVYWKGGVKSHYQHMYNNMLCYLRFNMHLWYMYISTCIHTYVCKCRYADNLQIFCKCNIYKHDVVYSCSPLSTRNASAEMYLMDFSVNASYNFLVKFWSLNAFTQNKIRVQIVVGTNVHMYVCMYAFVSMCVCMRIGICLYAALQLRGIHMKFQTHFIFCFWNTNAFYRKVNDVLIVVVAAAVAACSWLCTLKSECMSYRNFLGNTIKRHCTIFRNEFKYT